LGLFEPQYDPHKLGMDRILEDQKIFAAKMARDSWQAWDAPKVSNQQSMVFPASSSQSRPVDPGPGFAESYPRLSRFLFWLSMLTMVAGLGAAYLFSSEHLNGWWQLAGTLAGGAMGFITPRLSVMLLALLAYGLFSLLLGLAHLVLLALKLLAVGAALLGLLALIDYWAG
jgi:hypothetical protein